MKPLKLIIVAVTALSLECSLHAFIIESHMVNQDGTYTYSYTVDNSTSALFNISAWSLEFLITPDWNQNDIFAGGDVDVPDPWFALAGTPTIGISAQDFGAPSELDDVVVGTILGGFSFKSAYPPGTITFFEFGPAGESASGSTIGPVVPEPETLVLYSIVVIATLAAFRFRERIRPRCQS